MRSINIFLISISFAAILCSPVYAKIGSTSEEMEYLQESTAIITEVTAAIDGVDLTSDDESMEMRSKATEFLERAKELTVPTNNNPFWLCEHFALIGLLTCFINGYDVSLPMGERRDALTDSFQFAAISLLLLQNAHDLEQ